MLLALSYLSLFSSLSPLPSLLATELPLSDHPGMVVLREFLNFIDAFTVIVFSLEILLKWTDNFSAFWRDSWNVFDLIVTVLVSLYMCLFTWHHMVYCYMYVTQYIVVGDSNLEKL